MACGLIIKSGTIPDSVNGISSSGTIKPTTPFCPCLEANLSPSSGILKSLTLTFTNLDPLSDCINRTVSTIPLSLLLIHTEVSLLFCGEIPNSVGSSRNLGGDVLPINTSSGPTSVSGNTKPSSSRCVYASAPL